MCDSQRMNLLVFIPLLYISRVLGNIFWVTAHGSFEDHRFSGKDPVDK